MTLSSSPLSRETYSSPLLRETHSNPLLTGGEQQNFRVREREPQNTWVQAGGMGSHRVEAMGENLGRLTLRRQETTPAPSSIPQTSLFLEGFWNFQASEPENNLELEPSIPDVPSPGSASDLVLPNSQGTEVILTLADVIFLVLENNRTIKNQYLDRIVQQADLAVEEGKFTPRFTPRISLLGRRQRQGGDAQNTGDLDLGAGVSLRLPTGAEVSVNWSVLSQAQNGNDVFFYPGNSFNNNIQVLLSQPLLRGAGVEINRASINIARLMEDFNVYQLKSVLIDTLTDAIFAYRSLIQAQEALKIAELSLQNAQEELENFQFLIDVGQRARVDIVTNQTNVANRRFAVVAATNRVEQQR